MANHWLDTSEYPFTPHYFEVNGQQLHYVDEGQGDPVLYVHGTPSWSFDFRHVIKRLAGQNRVLAPDHIGFGLSDKPAEYDYDIRNHSRTLEKFVLEQDLRNITLVVHDFGGPIGWHVALQHPERFKRLVILNSWLWSSESDPDFLKLRKTLRSPLLPFLYRYLNFSPRFLLPLSFGDRKLSGKTLKQYTKPFGTRNQRWGALAFARSLLNDQAWFEELWQRKEVLAAKPTLLLWGMKDPILKPSYLRKFKTGFPDAQVEELESSGHFPQEEEPKKVAQAILSFMREEQVVR